MRSRNRSVKLPNALMDAGERRAEAPGYGSFNAYIAVLIRYDLLVRGPHLVTLPVARMKPEDQDAIDAERLRARETGEGRQVGFVKSRNRQVLARRLARPSTPTAMPESPDPGCQGVRPIAKIFCRKAEL